MHRAEVDAYREAVREEENSQRLKEQAAEARNNRVLSRDEYYELAKQRKAEQDAKDAAREAERQAKEDAEAAYLASQPEIAEVMEASPYLFLVRFQHWASLGYIVTEDSPHAFQFGLYHASLKKPATVKKSK